MLERLGLGPRLAIIGICAALAVTGVGGWALRLQFHATLWRSVEQRLDDSAQRLAVRLHAGPDGTPWEERPPSTSPFNQIFSGWYWQLGDGDGELHSRSLWDGQLHLPQRESLGGSSQLHRLQGPRGEPLVGLERPVRVGARELRLHLYGPATETDRELARLDQLLLLTQAVLVAVLTLTTLLQVQIGLKPLRRLRAALARVHDGTAERVGRDFGPDLDPLARAMDQVLERNARVVARARAHAGDLSHALKKPLALLASELRDHDGGVVPAMTVRAQVATMDGLIERYLARAGSGGGERRRIDVRERLEDLLAAMRRLHAGRDLHWQLLAPRALHCSAEQTDLEEMLGNLLDNAGKWARSRVEIQARADTDGLVVHIDDDGDGLANAQIAAAMRRGRRFDESVEGSGLGLAIVRDLAETYGGRLELGRSRLGGLSARLVLPP
ncbi:sensor histidine kinase [Pseudorhodoferax sp.]|uniref:sensor histidine kinase n=1 Tax=Pseudorhodoferax sp. TaxID=1993553 RepID=UPI0039E52CF5